jgi:Family of unknown function (DUF7009)
MKLRIKGNSIRLRLGQSDVLRLALDGTVEESTAFGPSLRQRFSYALSVSAEESGIRADFGNRHMVIRVPAKVIHQWVTTDQVSIDAIQRTGDDGELRILIEKDFECIDAPPGESQIDTFPNPHRSEEHSHAPRWSCTDDRRVPSSLELDS